MSLWKATIGADCEEAVCDETLIVYVLDGYAI